MRILHTSDWHLGRSLYGRNREAEFSAFLDWLLETITQQNIDVLIVAGDIFDTTTPSHSAQALYYRFLHQLATTTCQHAVVIGGNHDSPTFLEAPKALLRALNVYVVGRSHREVASAWATPGKPDDQAADDFAAEDSPEQSDSPDQGDNPVQGWSSAQGNRSAQEDGQAENELLLLRNQHNQVELIVAAAPYLRDSDLRQAQVGESLDDKEDRLKAGIKNYYDILAAEAQMARERHGDTIPVVATGHLFTAGGKTLEGDGVRDLYVGSLAHVGPGVFSPVFDYVALGHLHLPQKVGGLPHIRYSGSPLPMGFGEAGQEKSVCLIEFTGRQAAVETLAIPNFQRLEQISGDWPSLKKRLQSLRDGPCVWLEINYTGDEIMADLREQIAALTNDTLIEVLRIKNNRRIQRALEPEQAKESLNDLNEDDVFERCLEAHEVPDAQRTELRRTYKEVLLAMAEADPLSESSSLGNPATKRN